MIQAHAHSRPNISEIFYSRFLQQHKEKDIEENFNKDGDTQQPISLVKQKMLKNMLQKF